MSALLFVVSVHVPTGQKPHFAWSCANVLVSSTDPYSIAGANAFMDAATKMKEEKEIGIELLQFDFMSDSTDMKPVINRIIEKIEKGIGCLATMVFAQGRDLARLFLADYELQKERHKQTHGSKYKLEDGRLVSRRKYELEWIVGDNILASLDGVVGDLKKHLTNEEVHEVLQGMFSLGIQQVKDAEYEDFQRAWYAQPSSASMSPDGKRTKCSDAVDATGRYIWREDGQEDGRCCGIDFQQAAQKRRANKCNDDDPICLSAKISTYVPFSYDAAIALAHGLDRVLRNGQSPYNTTALSQAIRQSKFEGVSGKVSFLDNGDRDSGDLHFTVYNYHATTHKFEAIGRMVGDNFYRCQAVPCPDMTFSDGRKDIPDVKVEKHPVPLVPIISIASLSGLLVIAVAVFLYRRKRQKLKEIKAHHLQIMRLNKNWSELLESEGVGGLSHMSEEWKSGIVPVRSKTGEALNERLKSMAKQIHTISIQWACCGRERRARLLALDTTLRNFMEKEIAPFFASRDRMYKSSLLLKHPTSKKTIAGVTSNETKKEQFRIKRMLTSDGVRPWPENSTPLFLQIMLLLRDLDNMFKASYNQRYDLRIMNDEQEAYTEWMTNQLPKLILEGLVLKQNTSNIFELYGQAAEVHSFYNSVCKRIARETGAEWHLSPLKKIFRILEKAEHVERDGDGSVFFDCSKIFDIVRGTLIYDTLGDEDGGVLRGVRALFDSDHFQIIRVKDRFSIPTSGSWRDVLLNARMILSNGIVHTHIVEVQLHQRDLRDERMNVGGHYIYERQRALLEACTCAFGDEATAKLQDLHSASSLSSHEKRRKSTLQSDGYNDKKPKSNNDKKPKSMLQTSEPETTTAFQTATLRACRVHPYV